MTKVLIIEDEAISRNNLAKMLKDNFPDLEIVGMTSSVGQSVAFLRERRDVDIIFMDVELSDGDCFEIFRQAEVKAKVIMTTAYDSYAIKAFEAGSIDYLLKPVSGEALKRAVGRCRERLMESSDLSKLIETIESGRQKPSFRKRLVVKVGKNIIPVEMSEVAYFLSEDKVNYLVTKDGRKLITDFTMDKMETELDPEDFFRISRGCIVSRHAVKEAGRYLNGRLEVKIEPPYGEEVLVSRSRVDDFLEWLE